MIDLASFTPEIQRACEKLPVKRLSVFGSALTDKFGAVSDIDVLVTFDGLAKSRHARESGHPVFGQVIEVPGFPPARE